MDYSIFEQITKKGNFIAWGNDTKPDVIAIAYMSDDGWFNEAINCTRDSQMGDLDEDGVYSRHWFEDEVWTTEEPRLATREEIFLYLHKVNLQECGILNEDGTIRTLVNYGYSMKTQEPQMQKENTPTRLELRQRAFCMYINELCDIYRRNNHKLIGMAEIRNKHHITGISKEQFFDSELDKASGYISQEFCNKLYDYVLDNTKSKPAPIYK